MQRIFIDQHQLKESTILLSKESYHHLINVCRLSERSQLDVVIDGKRLLNITITEVLANGIAYKINDQWSLSSSRPFKISLIQSLPKQDKLTDICRMCTEIGVATFYPVITEFCDVKQLSDNKFRRIQTAIDSAAKQSKQSSIPTLQQPQSLATCLANIPFTPTTLALVAYENATQGPSAVLKESTFDHLVLAIGPEGGFGANDLTLFESSGFVPFSLGGFILRTEHAGFAAINQLDGCLSKI